MQSISKAMKQVGGLVSKHSTTILTTFAVGGLITTVIFAVRVTPKAIVIIHDDSEEAHDGDSEAYTYKEAFKSSWKFYIPATAMGIATIACIIGANAINQRRNAALATLYSLTDVAFREYQEKVVETLGKNKEAKVHDDIDSDHVKSALTDESHVICTGYGEVLCLDSLSGRAFKSDIEHIRRCVNNVNRDFMNGMNSWVSLNDLYYELSLPSIKLGEFMGWNLEKGLIDVSYSSQLTEEGRPCLVLDYKVEPKFMN